ncbi:hypothetical protein BH11ARM2_BH11ARM2_32110 [soil metagenome]
MAALPAVSSACKVFGFAFNLHMVDGYMEQVRYRAGSSGWSYGSAYSYYTFDVSPMTFVTAQIGYFDDQNKWHTVQSQIKQSGKFNWDLCPMPNMYG